MTPLFTLTTPNGNFKIIGVPKNINPDDIGEKTKVYNLSDITEDMAKEWGYDLIDLRIVITEETGLIDLSNILLIVTQTPER